jgi:glycoprotein 2-beta-D-xylosyltransferase
MNLGNLENSLRAYSNATSVEIVRFEMMSHAEQVRTVREADILIGNHGAGLSNLMFMDRNSSVVEFTDNFLDFFVYLAEWKGIHHHLLEILREQDEMSEYELMNALSKVKELLGEVNTQQQDPEFWAHEMNDQENPLICSSFNLSALFPTHGCQFNSDTQQMYCNFINLRIDNSLIKVAHGGEKLETVMGRNETDELPVYSKGAFSVPLKPTFDVPVEQRAGIHYLEDVLNNLVYPTTGYNQGNGTSSCVETRNGTTLMITRYEYVNLYHTLTDWWNAFSVLLPEQVERREKVNILFLDGHAQGNLDGVWEEVFGAVEYVKQLPRHGVCFERAVFIPPGYTSSLFPDTGGPYNPARVRCPTPSIAEAFSSFFLQKYGLETVKPIPGRVVIIDRQPYISHPRSNPDGFQRKMNLGNLENSLRTYSNATSVEIVRFETMSHAEQVRTVREAHILIGNHGAGLSNLMFMDRNSSAVEFTTGFLMYFRYLAKWKGVHHELFEIHEAFELSTMELMTIVSMVNKAIMEYPSSILADGVSVESNSLT